MQRRKGCDSMKKLGSFFLIAALVLSLALTAAAVETVSCTVSADSVSAAAGSTVTVPVRIAGNPGFTNFAIALDYDHEQLELISINVSDGEDPYLCGSLVATNIGWIGEDGTTYGYVTEASAEVVSEDGILFTATFKVSENFSGTAFMLPVVQYVRNNEAVISVFESVPVISAGGTVSAEMRGDFDRNGLLDVFDVMGLYNAVSCGQSFEQADMARLDMNNDNNIDIFDVMSIYDDVMNGQ